MKSVVVYSSARCPYCVRAKQLLESKGVSYNELRVDQEPGLLKEVVQRSGGKRTVPQIFIDDYHVGGCEELYALERQGELDPILASE